MQNATSSSPKRTKSTCGTCFCRTSAFLRPIRGKRIPPKRKTPTCPTRSWARSQPLQRALFAANVFGLLMPRPSKVNEEFSRIREREGASKASDHLYSLSVKSGYVQKTAIARNLKWKYDDGKSGLEITVNLSKPEKNNKDIAGYRQAPHRAQGQQIPFLCALQGERGLRRLCDPPAQKKSSHDQADARRRKVVFAVLPLCLLRGTLHRHQRRARPHARRRKHPRQASRFCGHSPPLFHREQRFPSHRGRVHPRSRALPGRQAPDAHASRAHPHALCPSRVPSSYLRHPRLVQQRRPLRRPARRGGSLRRKDHRSLEDVRLPRMRYSEPHGRHPAQCLLPHPPQDRRQVLLHHHPAQQPHGASGSSKRWGSSFCRPA